MNSITTTYQKATSQIPQSVSMFASITSSLLWLLFKFIITVLIAVGIIMSPMVILYQIGLQHIAKFYPVIITIGLSLITVIAIIKTDSINY